MVIEIERDLCITTYVHFSLSLYICIQFYIYVYVYIYIYIYLCLPLACCAVCCTSACSTFRIMEPLHVVGLVPATCRSVGYHWVRSSRNQWHMNGDYRLHQVPAGQVPKSLCMQVPSLLNTYVHMEVCTYVEYQACSSALMRSQCDKKVPFVLCCVKQCSRLRL